MSNYILSEQALDDINKIWIYTAENWSVEQADRYYNLIFDEIEYLCLKPDSGYELDQIRKGYFRSKVKSHLIFYKINNKQSKMEIIRILHQMMDIETHLK